MSMSAASSRLESRRRYSTTAKARWRRDTASVSSMGRLGSGLKCIRHKTQRAWVRIQAQKHRSSNSGKLRTPRVLSQTHLANSYWIDFSLISRSGLSAKARTLYYVYGCNSISNKQCQFFRTEVNLKMTLTQALWTHFQRSATWASWTWASSRSCSPRKGRVFADNSGSNHNDDVS